MKRYNYILILYIIFTAYLFSQTEENKIIIDTVINIDSVMVSEPVNEIEEKIDLKDYLYKDYLEKNDSTDYTIEKIGIISARVGTGYYIPIAVSITLDIPISGMEQNITFHCATFIGSHIIGLGLGYVSKRTNNLIIKENVRLSYMYLFNKPKFGLFIGTDILFKVYKPFYLSISMEGGFGSGTMILMISLGLNIVY
jgi:hypothetical protein